MKNMSPIINAFICNVIKHVCDVITIRETELKDKRGLLPRIHFELLCLLRQCRTVGSIDATNVQRSGSVSDDVSEQVHNGQHCENACCLLTYADGTAKKTDEKKRTKSWEKPKLSK